MGTGSIIDIGALLLVVFLALRGARKGLIQTLAGIVILAVALLGAGYASGRLADPLAERLLPVIEARLEAQMSSALESSAASGGETGGGDAALSDIPPEALESAPPQVLLRLPEGMELPAGVQEKLETLIQERLSDLGSTAGSAIRDALQGSIQALLAEILPLVCARIVFLIAFFVISAGLHFVLRMLHPVLDLPGLHMLNTVGGGALGLVQGLLLAAAAAWFFQHFGEMLGLEGLESSFLLRFISEHTAALPRQPL